MLTCRDVSQIAENAKLSADNKILSFMSSSVSHEMITPLKCIIQMVLQMQQKFSSPQLKYDAELIENTAFMLLNQVKGNLDRNLLDQNMF